MLYMFTYFPVLHVLDVMPQIIHQTDPVLNSRVIATVYPYSAISLHPYGAHV